MKTIWNEGPERVKKENKILIDALSTVKTPPPYETAVITVQNNAQTSSNLYPSLNSFVSCAKPPPLPPLEMNKETIRLHGAAQPSMAWVQEGTRIIFKPATMTDIDTICKILSNPNNILTVYKYVLKYYESRFGVFGSCNVCKCNATSC